MSPMAFSFEGESCRECGEEELVWWSKDETETTLELYMDCRGCDYEYPKVFVDRSEDTSDSALKDRLRGKL